MLSRIKGVQKNKFHLYQGKEILSKEDFYKWGLENNDFKQLYENYVKNNYERKLAPSPDRKDSTKGYTLETMSENSKRGNKSKNTKNE